MKDLIKSLLPTIAIKKYRAYRTPKKYRGSDVTCPICNSSFKKFAPFGSSKRENRKCHYCGSLERHRLIFLYLNEKFNFFNKNSNDKIRLLHFAPERMFYNIFSEYNGIDYFPCDLMPERMKYNGKTNITKADITDIPFQDNSFNFIICSHVLEHIPDDHLAMSELYRVLSKNGNSILQVPIDNNREKTYEDPNISSPEERMKAYGHPDHVRFYGKDYKTKLEKCGFKVNEDNFVSTLNKNDIIKYGLIESELIYHCKK
ncbi:class I SAM-dependent methyltransferase [Aegicerativicinus sediminis]|uniref:class I SAM-dependent methyltransferase n=1 Tax=Aegicerativicinus sediminis TaxID=2893202 RepID=UPI001E61C6BB|nr:class I SAM-dependent methyltransferase [Aegicerativicinus sediminis]